MQDGIVVGLLLGGGLYVGNLKKWITMRFDFMIFGFAVLGRVCFRSSRFDKF